jgi:hypothetical protein
MDGGLGDDVGVEAVTEVDGVDVVAGAKLECADRIAASRGSAGWARRLLRAEGTYHSRSLYMIVKKTCRKRLTAFINTASRYSHASPVIVRGLCAA